MTAPDPGLCADCAFVRTQRSARGSSFVRCGRADTDPVYRRYPPLPVVACPGFTSDPTGPNQSDAGGEEE